MSNVETKDYIISPEDVELILSAYDNVKFAFKSSSESVNDTYFTTATLDFLRLHSSSREAIYSFSNILKYMEEGSNDPSFDIKSRYANLVRALGAFYHKLINGLSILLQDLENPIPLSEMLFVYDAGDNCFHFHGTHEHTQLILDQCAGNVCIVPFTSIVSDEKLYSAYIRYILDIVKSKIYEPIPF